MITLASCQPDYFPALVRFDAIRRADVYVLSDDVPLGGSSWRNRNRLHGLDGPVWFTVPLKRHQQHVPIKDVLVAHQDWKAAHEGKLQTLYGRAPYVSDALGILRAVCAVDSDRLADYAATSVIECARALGIRTPIVRASLTGVEHDGDKNGRLIGLCRRLGASYYLAAAASRDYLDVDRFATAGIGIEFQDYRPAPYPQVGPGGVRLDFSPHLSILDAVANLGFARTREAL